MELVETVHLIDLVKVLVAVVVYVKVNVAVVVVVAAVNGDDDQCLIDHLLNSYHCYSSWKIQKNLKIKFFLIFRYHIIKLTWWLFSKFVENNLRWAVEDEFCDWLLLELVCCEDNCEADEEVSTDWDCNETDDPDDIVGTDAADGGGGVLLGVLWCLFKIGVFIDPEPFVLMFTFIYTYIFRKF